MAELVIESHRAAICENNINLSVRDSHRLDRILDARVVAKTINDWCCPVFVNQQTLQSVEKVEAGHVFHERSRIADGRL